MYTASEKLSTANITDIMQTAYIDYSMSVIVSRALPDARDGLKPVQRDRNAAWFAEPDGARLMICSELGSEGRNFQHARHLVLFDLPLDPDLVEQRIGRLDRIGQTEPIHIHVPYLTGSADEVVAAEAHARVDHGSLRALLFAQGYRAAELVSG